MKQSNFFLFGATNDFAAFAESNEHKFNNKQSFVKKSCEKVSLFGKTHF